MPVTRVVEVCLQDTVCLADLLELLCGCFIIGVLIGMGCKRELWETMKLQRLCSSHKFVSTTDSSVCTLDYFQGFPLNDGNERNNQNPAPYRFMFKYKHFEHPGPDRRWLWPPGVACRPSMWIKGCGGVEVYRDAPNNCTHVIVRLSESDPEVAKAILNRAKAARNCVP